jgi:hypothetical protein
MTFLSTGLLAGLIATGIPIALHLLARQQPKRVVFPATRFLTQSLHTQRDRLKLRRWWLLALRILAIALLAIALARPQIQTVTSETWFFIGASAMVGVALLALATVAFTSNQSKPLRYGLAMTGMLALLGSAIFGGVTMARTPTATITDSSPAAVAIVLDNSIRSSRKLRTDNQASTTLLERMREAATWMVREQTPDSLIAIVDRSSRPATFSIDAGAAANRIERTQTIAQVVPLAERVRAAIGLVRSSELERRSVLLITDMTEPSFDESQWESAGLKALLDQEPAITLQILDVGSEAKSNYSLDQVFLGDPTPPRMAKTGVSVVVRSPQSDENRAMTLNVQLDLFDTSSDASVGLPVVRDSNVVLPPIRSADRTTIKVEGQAMRALLSVPPLEVGTHHGMIRLITEDEFDADNVQYVTWVVREPKNVLIVGADPDDANNLAGAIAAPLAIDDPQGEYELELSEFTPSDGDAWKRHAVIVLIDPQSPSPPVRGALESYMRSGGKVLSLLGPSLLRPEDTTDPFPSGLLRPWRVPPPGTFLEVIRPNHPSVASLREVAGGVPWSTFRISQYWQLASSPDDVVIARYAGTDHPALIERSVHRGDDESGVSPGGSHLIFTTPMPALAKTTRPWNELFAGTEAWPAFLLIRDMIDSLAHRDSGTHNLLIGQSTQIPIVSRSIESSEDTSGITRNQLFPPTGPPIPVMAENGLVTLTQLDALGTYWVRSAGGTTGVSANLPPAEFMLDRIDPLVLDDWLGKDSFTIVRSTEEIRQAEGRGQPTRSLSPTLLLLLLGAFVLEQILSNRFYASRASSTRAVAAA